MTRENKMVELLQQENTSEVGKEDENLILLLLSSDLRDRYMKTLVDRLIKIGVIVAIEEIPRNQSDKYGIIEGEEVETGIFRISSMVEKPEPNKAPTNLAIIGRYILTPTIFDYIRNLVPGPDGEIQITDAIN